MNQRKWYPSLGQIVFSILLVSLTQMLVGSTLASQPGQPLGPEDWVFNEPGMWAELASEGETAAIMSKAVCDQDQICYDIHLSSNHSSFDAMGRIIGLSQRQKTLECDPPSIVFDPLLVAVSPEGNSLSVLGSLPTRCASEGLQKFDSAYALSTDPILIDRNNGTALIHIISIQGGIPGGTGETPDYEPIALIHRIHGLPNNFDILTTFTPDTTQLTWSSPFMPMGLPQRAADSFDVFRGDMEQLHTSGPTAFSGMESVACEVGATDLPEVGKRYTVDLPTQEAQVEYYLVSANVGSESRYGRWQLDGSGPVKGRNPTVMPECRVTSP